MTLLWLEGTTSGTSRQHYVDWLRVLAVLLLFPFHVSRVFNMGEAFYVKSAHLWSPLGYVLGFISQWHMQLLFLLAGMSTYFALRKRGGGRYVAGAGETPARAPRVRALGPHPTPDLVRGAHELRLQRLVLALPGERRFPQVEYQGRRRLLRRFRHGASLVHHDPLHPLAGGPAAAALGADGAGEQAGAPCRPRARASLLVAGGGSGGLHRRRASRPGRSRSFLLSGVLRLGLRCRRRPTVHSGGRALSLARDHRGRRALAVLGPDG